jgi:hypothetical protein
VIDLLTADFIAAMRDKLRTDMNNYTDDLANGQCHDYATYKELCGVIRGLAFAERHLLDLADLMKEDNDE